MDECRSDYGAFVWRAFVAGVNGLGMLFVQVEFFTVTDPKRMGRKSIAFTDPLLNF